LNEQQSEFVLQPWSSPHTKQTPPPQSMSVSLPSWMPFWHVSAQCPFLHTPD
jgi:hypothetical protein